MISHLPLASSAAPAPGSRAIQSRTAWLDAAGITISVVCAIHCAASAIFLAALALVGFAGALPEWLEWAFLATSASIGAIALRHGHRMHGQSMPLRVFGCGIAALLLARVTGVRSHGETFFVVIGASALVIAHLCNWRLTRERRASIAAERSQRAPDATA